jgi:hypothetical protein
MRKDYSFSNELSSSSSSIISSSICSSASLTWLLSSVCSFISFMSSSLRAASYRPASPSKRSMSTKRGWCFASRLSHFSIFLRIGRVCSRRCAANLRCASLSTFETMVFLSADFRYDRRYDSALFNHL